ncbi:MAG: hypothetical protein CMO01_18665 [Thalassobius sp.]|nr:hypothetical protein [Thalassovita sp.]
MKVIFLLLGFILSQQLLFAQNQLSQAVFQVDYPNPTADKPQSKLWYMDNCWWAILPKSTGPSLWQRTENGWVEHVEIHEKLKGVPGRADVYVDDHNLIAVGVEAQQLVVFRLEKNKKWSAEKLATFSLTEKESVETATITLDKNGNGWLAAVAGDKVSVWASNKGLKKWSGPFTLAEGIGKDDICTITSLPEGVGVIWSDQINEAVKIRIHNNGNAFNDWEKETIIESGNNTADDHLNTALSKDGTLWLTTKNSVDEVGGPQFVLRVRTADGKWSNYPYCNLGKVEQPSRPIILTVENKPSLILNGYTIYNGQNRHLANITFGKIDTAQANIIEQVTPVIVPDTTNWSKNNHINNVTGSKNPLPANAPWIILASDEEGRVYEADLSLYFNE